jgi:hypothetical protein
MMILSKKCDDCDETTGMINTTCPKCGSTNLSDFYDFHVRTNEEQMRFMVSIYMELPEGLVINGSDGNTPIWDLLPSHWFETERFNYDGHEWGGFGRGRRTKTYEMIWLPKTNEDALELRAEMLKEWETPLMRDHEAFIQIRFTTT